MGTTSWPTWDFSHKPLTPGRNRTTVRSVKLFFTVEQVITAREKARKPPATQKYLFRMRQSLLVKGFVSAANVGKPAPKHVTLFSMSQFTLEKGLMNAAIVENILATNLVSLDIRELTVEEGSMTAVTVGNPLA